MFMLILHCLFAFEAACQHKQEALHLVPMLCWLLYFHISAIFCNRPAVRICVRCVRLPGVAYSILHVAYLSENRLLLVLVGRS